MRRKQWKARGKVGRYRHYAKRRAGKFDKRSIRTIRVGKHGRLIRVGCPKGQWRRGRCRVGMRALSMLVPAANPLLSIRQERDLAGYEDVLIKQRPALELSLAKGMSKADLASLAGVSAPALNAFVIKHLPQYARMASRRQAWRRRHGVGAKTPGAWTPLLRGSVFRTPAHMLRKSTSGHMGARDPLEGAQGRNPLRPFAGVRSGQYPRWDIDGRSFGDVATARAYAQQSVLTHGRDVTIMQKDDRMSPWFMLEKWTPANVRAAYALPKRNNPRARFKISIKRTPSGLHLYAAYASGVGSYGYGNTPAEARLRLFQRIIGNERNAAAVAWARSQLAAGDKIKYHASGLGATRTRRRR